MTPLDILLAVSYQLAELSERDAYLRAASVVLAQVFGVDDVFWVETNFANDSPAPWHGIRWAADRALGRALMSATDHPVVASYVASPHDLAPRRLLDVVTASQWRSSVAAELLRPTMGDLQLSMVVRMDAPTSGDGWIITRSGSDFTDTDVELATALLPLLTAFDHVQRIRSRTTDAGHPIDQAPTSYLTARETDILTCVSYGMTANAIGNLYRISPRTVHKHLEHAYDKLGEHDRLRAVDRARSMGLIPPA